MTIFDIESETSDDLWTSENEDESEDVDVADLLVIHAIIIMGEMRGNITLKPRILS